MSRVEVNVGFRADVRAFADSLEAAWRAVGELADGLNAQRAAAKRDRLRRMHCTYPAKWGKIK